MIRLVVLGDLNLDVHVEQGTPIEPGEEVRDLVHVSPGGSAGTFARIASELGADVTFIGAVGDDIAGEMLERSLTAAGVHSKLQRTALPSGVIVALHRGGDRSMICSRGANEALDASKIYPRGFEAIHHLHVSGYALLSDAQRPAARRAIALARDAGASVSVDPPPANLIRQFGIQRFLEEISIASWVFPNEDEGRVLTGTEDLSQIVTLLSSKHEAGALTLGRRGAMAWRGRERATAVVDSPLTIDPTGAGDAYAAAFVVGLLSKLDLQTANAQACDSARRHLLRRAKVDSRTA
jgi:ribokinase